MIDSYTNEDAKGMKIYSCNSCGGEIICEETTSSTTCPYCGNNLVVSKELHGDLKPNCIIPFKKDKDFSIDALKKFIRRRPLLPHSFSQTNTIQEIKSLYVPFWVFDADVTGKVRFKGETTKTWEDANYRYRETRYYSLVRGGGVGFEHVPVDGSKKMEDQLMESIEPYTWSETKEFNVAYLAGYSADRYDVSKEETFGRATERFRQGTAEAFRRDIHGYNNVTVEDSNLQFNNTETRYVLYPVWLLNVKWKEKNYRFGLNGETGKIAGNLPISVSKSILFSALLFLIPALIFFFIAFAICSFNPEKILAPILIGLVLGLVIAIFGMKIMVGKNKNVKFSYGAFPYEKKDSCYIDTRKDIFLYKKVTRTAKANNNKR